MNGARLSRRSGGVVLLPLVVLALLAGCAEGESSNPVADSASSPSPSPTPSPSPSPSSSELPLCPLGGDGSQPSGECIPVDTDANMDLNNAYAARLPISEQARAELDRFVGPMTAALQPLADGAVSITADAVSDALASVDIEPVQTKGDRDFIGFAYGTGSGCVFGEVKAGSLTVETGGPIADGGCMTAPGH